MKSRFAHAVALAATVGLAASLPAEIIVYTGTDTATLTGRPPIFRTRTTDVPVATIAVTVATTGNNLTGFAPTLVPNGSLGRITGAPAIIDGIGLAPGHLVLVKDQTLPAQNGIYAVTATTTIWDRWAQFNEISEINETSEQASNVRIQVDAGVVNVGRLYDKTATPVSVINTDPIDFILVDDAVVVIAASTGPLTGVNAGVGTFTNAPTILDGVTLSNRLVLVKDQVNAAQNGIYRVNAATRTWTRWTEFDETNEITTGFKVHVVGGFRACGLTFENITSPSPDPVNTDPITFAPVADSNPRERMCVGLSAPVTVPIKHEFLLLRDLKTGGTAVIFFSSLSTGQASRPYIWQYPPLDRMGFLSRTLGSSVIVRNPQDTPRLGEGYFVDIDYSDSQDFGLTFPYLTQPTDTTNNPLTFPEANVPRLLTPYEDNGRVDTFHGVFSRNIISPTAATTQEFETFTPGNAFGLGLPESANRSGLSSLDTQALTVAKPLTNKPALSIPVGTLFTTTYSGFAYGYFSPTDPSTTDPESAITGRSKTTPTLPTVGGALSDVPTTDRVTEFADAYVTGTFTMRLAPALSELTVGLTGGNATLQKAMEIVTDNLSARLVGPFTPIRDTVTFPAASNDVYYNNMTDEDYANLPTP